MAKCSTPKGKIVRRLGINIFGNPKFDKLLRKKPHGPGKPKGDRPKRPSEYAKQLMEKQKIRYCYGISEKQLRNVFKKAKSLAGQTGHNLLILLERRLDNVLYRLGMAETRIQARQIITHGHITVNGTKVKSPGFLVRKDDVIKPKEKQKSKAIIEGAFQIESTIGAPSWLSADEDKLTGNVDAMPIREDIATVAQEQLVVEYYAKFV